jgi:hypothetical protein
VITQISFILIKEPPKELSNSKKELKLYLYEQLVQFSKRDGERLVIILDSIDQLANDAYSLDWLLVDLPDNVKFIYSTLPDHENILKNFKKIDKISRQNYIEV